MAQNNLQWKYKNHTKFIWVIPLLSMIFPVLQWLPPVCSRRWFFRIDGSECTVPDRIDARLYHSQSFDNHRPAAITGYCRSAGGRAIRKGTHNIILSIEHISGRDAYTCWNSVCRIVVEEVPPPANAFPG